MSARLARFAGGVVLLAACALLAAPAAQARRLGSVDFEPCQLDARDGSSAPVAAECAQFEVAENPAAPQRRRISLRLALLPARARKPQPDLVVYLAGGPGQSALDSYPTLAAGFREVLRDRHVLLVDQRGTGGSNRLDCPVDPADAAGPGSDDWPDPATRQARVQRCLATVQAHADPRFYTTADAVRDLFLLREALGRPPLDLVGVSYGTRVALAALATRPAAIRALVLDGVVVPGVPLGQSHARHLDDALATIFAACRKQPACAARFGDPAATLAALRARVAAEPIVRQLPDPLTGEWQPRRLTPATLAGSVRLMAYQPELAALLPQALDEAAHGQPQALLAQGQVLGQPLLAGLARGMALSVGCSEDAPVLRPDPADAGRLLGNQLVDELRLGCADWPRGAVAPGIREPVHSDVPALLLSGEWDPVTPPADAATVAAGLPASRALVARGRGHAVLWRGCAGKLAAQFLRTLDAAALDASCLDRFGETPAFTSRLGPPP